MCIFKRHNLGLIFAILLVATAVVVACQGETSPPMSPPASISSPTMTSRPTLPPTPSPKGTIETPSILTPTPEAPGLPDAPIEERAQEALANLLGIPSEEIEVRKVEEVEWPDTSLGCPEPGKAYAQVIVPGWRVVMRVDDEVYEYHSGGEHRVLCDQKANFISVLPSPTATSITVPGAPTPTVQDVCPMMPVFPHGRVCPTPWTPHD